MRKDSVLIRDADGNKKCLKCLRWVPVADFHGWVKATDGLQNHCKLCQRLGRYKMTAQEFMARLDRQNWQCPICKRALEITNNGVVVDHNRACCPGNFSCGMCVRALLCSTCNLGLGMFKDSLNLLTEAQAYLRRHELKVTSV